jgi:hypothetical protein
VSYRSDKITKKYRSIRPSYASSKISRAKQKLPYNSNKMTNKNYRSTKHHELNKRIKTKYTIKDRQTHQQHKNAITAMNKVKASSQIGFTTEPYADKNWQRQKPIIGINNSNNNNKNYQNMTKSYQQPKAVKNIKTKSNKSINKATKSTKTNYSYSKQKSMATKPVKKQHVANQRRTKVKHSASEKIRRH